MKLPRWLKICIRGQSIRVRAYPVMEQAVEDGVIWGWQRAHKYVRRPTEDQIKDAMFEETMREIAEAFDFEEK